MQHHLETIARETGISLHSVSATAKLIAEGGTCPFISRYRKEQTGSLDEVQITTIRDRMLQLAELDGRRTAILKSLEESNLLSPGLKKKVDAATTLATLEDIFAPLRPKRQTRATRQSRPDRAQQRRVLPSHAKRQAEMTRKLTYSSVAVSSP